MGRASGAADRPAAFPTFRQAGSGKSGSGQGPFLSSRRPAWRIVREYLTGYDRVLKIGEGYKPAISQEREAEVL
jgi:hypothetical protein